MKNWILLLLIGAFSILSGVLAIFNPFAASLAAERIAAWTFLIIGAFQLATVFRAQNHKSRWLAATLAALSLIAGIALSINPFEGLISLTVLLALIFLSSGIAKIVLSVKNREHSYWWAVMLSGLVSICLAFIIYTNLPFSAAGILGIMLGFELLSNGINLIAYSLILKRENHTAPPKR